ncbi:MAG: M14 family metallopeptidase [Acidobacteria bacterium]|nr:M14 family metallopeptidase [Acidobacteriota bacterium]
MKHFIAVAMALAAASGVHGQAPGTPSGDALQTRPERTGFQETSRYADVVAFLEALAKAAPAVHLTTFGKTSEGRSLPLAVIGVPDATPQAVRRTGKLRVYIQGNIHGGEVEGKESAQMLLRDLAQGKHAEWLQSMVLLVAPIYNADGNERIALNNRGPQHGPMGGQGQRPNAQGLDLNRDHMKLDSPEARAVVRLMNDYDPHVSIDLHTTNGTRHAYFLTYAPPLNPSIDPAIVGLLRNDWLPSVTRTIRSKYGWDYYYYGNLQGRGATPGTPDERSWRSFDHRPRFNNNYIGLRNRVAILSEAYAYATFEDRIAATNRFVEEVLNYAHAHAAGIRKLTEAADSASLIGTKLSLHAELERARELVEILLGEITEEKHPVDGHTMHRRVDVKKPERMAEYGTFKPTHIERVPSAYYVPADLTDALDRLRAHGIRMSSLGGGEKVQVEEFQIQGSEVAANEFQKHRERSLTGTWVAAERQLPKGTLKIDMTQPLARLAFYLIEPRSDDGLVNWNLLDTALTDAKVFPIVRTRQ